MRRNVIPEKERPARTGGNRAAGANTVQLQPTAPVFPVNDAAPPSALLVNARDAAAMLALSPRKLWELTNCGAIPCVRIGRAVRYAVSDLRAFVDTSRGARRD